MAEPPDDEDARQRANLIMLLAALILVVGGVWLLIKFRESSQTLDCIAAGHRNCVPIEIPASQ
jgi:hypothetical protein